MGSQRSKSQWSTIQTVGIVFYYPSIISHGIPWSSIIFYHHKWFLGFFGEDPASHCWSLPHPGAWCSSTTPRSPGPPSNLYLRRAVVFWPVTRQSKPPQCLGEPSLPVQSAAALCSSQTWPEVFLLKLWVLRSEGLTFDFASRNSECVQVHWDVEHVEHLYSPWKAKLEFNTYWEGKLFTLCFLVHLLSRLSFYCWMSQCTEHLKSISLPCTPSECWLSNSCVVDSTVGWQSYMKRVSKVDSIAGMYVSVCVLMNYI